MSIVEVRDHVIWAKHIHGNDALKNKIVALTAGSVLRLAVDGFHGVWKKMDDGADGLPTPGIKPIAEARNHWHELQAERGKTVAISEAF